MHKVLIIVGDASETLDTMYPYYRLIEAGFQPVVAAPSPEVVTAGAGDERKAIPHRSPMTAAPQYAGHLNFAGTWK